MKTVQELFEMEAQVKAGTVTQEDFLEACETQGGVRLCNECGKLITDGCVWGDGEHVECEACMVKSTTPEAWEEAVNNDDAYWTQWEEDIEE